MFVNNKRLKVHFVVIDVTCGPILFVYCVFKEYRKPRLTKCPFVLKTTICKLVFCAKEGLFTVVAQKGTRSIYRDEERISIR